MSWMDSVISATSSGGGGSKPVIHIDTVLVEEQTVTIEDSGAVISLPDSFDPSVSGFPKKLVVKINGEYAAFYAGFGDESSVTYQMELRLAPRLEFSLEEDDTWSCWFAPAPPFEDGDTYIISVATGSIEVNRPVFVVHGMIRSWGSENSFEAIETWDEIFAAMQSGKTVEIWANSAQSATDINYGVFPVRYVARLNQFGMDNEEYRFRTAPFTEYSFALGREVTMWVDVTYHAEQGTWYAAQTAVTA